MLEQGKVLQVTISTVYCRLYSVDLQMIQKIQQKLTQLFV